MTELRQILIELKVEGAELRPCQYMIIVMVKTFLNFGTQDICTISIDEF